MIIWLASYPKSGNTWIRSFISALLCTDEGQNDFSNLKNIRQGKHFEIEVDEIDETMAKKKIDIMCKKLLVNLIIEDYKINKIQ